MLFDSMGFVTVSQSVSNALGELKCAFLLKDIHTTSSDRPYNNVDALNA
jgi:hypothetical protein